MEEFASNQGYKPVPHQSLPMIKPYGLLRPDDGEGSAAPSRLNDYLSRYAVTRLVSCVLTA